FGVCRIINFAHGGFFMLGAYVTFTVVHATSNSVPMFMLALLGSTIGIVAVGMAFEMLFLRRIYRSPQAFQLLLTFGLVLVLGDLAKLIWGREENSIPVPASLEGFVRPFGVSFPLYRIFLIVFGVMICISFWGLLYRTRWGTLVRAAAADREM